MTDTYDYPEEFRSQISSLLLNPKLYSRFKNLILPEYFPTDFEVEFVQSIVEHKDTHGNLPTAADLFAEYKTRYDGKPKFAHINYKDYEDYVNLVFSHNNGNLKKTESEVVEWAQNNAMALALMESVDLLQQGKHQDIRELVSAAMKVGSEDSDLGKELILDADKWLHEYKDMTYLPTPWPHMNKIIGGLGKGELGLILAPAGGYKTTSLVNIGYEAATIINRRNVLHVSLEVSELKTLMRYAYRATFHKYEPASGANKYIEELKLEARKKLRGRIRVKQYPSNRITIRDLEDLIKDLQDEGFVPDTLIIDYPSKLLARRRYKERRHELNEIHEDCRALAVEYNIEVWGAVQANRGAFNKKIITMESIGEDISIGQVADIIVAACQTLDEAKLKILRFFLAKVREAESKGQIRAKIRYPAIVSTGIVTDDAADESEEEGEEDE